MYLDNDPINVGDKVFNVISGRYNKVVALNGEKAVVSADGTQVLVDSKGSVNGTRRFYWHNPAMVIPRKCNNDVASLVKDLYDSVIKVCK